MNKEDPQLTAYALGELSEQERAEIEARLATSPEAQLEVDETREVANLLTQALASEASSIPLHSSLETALAPQGATALDSQPPTVIPVAGWRFGWRLWTGAIAAGLMVAAGLWWVWPLRENPSTMVFAKSSDSPSAPATPQDAVKGDTRSPADRTPLEAPTSRATASVAANAIQPSNAIPPAPVTMPEPLRLEPIPPRWSVELESTERSRPPAAQDPQTHPSADAPAPAPAVALLPAPVNPKEITDSTSSARQQTAANKPALQRTLQSSTTPASARERLAENSQIPSAADALDLAQSGRRTSTSLAPRPEESPETLRFDVSRSFAIAPTIVPDSGSRKSRGVIRSESQIQSIAKSVEQRVESKDGYLADGVAMAPNDNPGYIDVGVNAFQPALTEPLSTLSLDVDTGSYANVRRFLSAGRLPPVAAVRVEEMVNYFPYHYPIPGGDDVFGVMVDVAKCPWEDRHRLVRIAIKARDFSTGRPSANLVFLIDVSGSMQPAERLPLLKQALRAMVKRLPPSDRVAIVTYASIAGVRLESTSCEEKEKILSAIDSLEAGGSTNGEGGIQQAYDMAIRHFIPGGVNRVLLCTDGDFNVGMKNQEELVRWIKVKARSGVFLTTLGVGTDNFKDALMRRLADQGNGVYHYLDSFEEAQKVLIEQMNATLVTIARDARMQVEFNPGKVGAWRLIGYEKRLMPHRDFSDDTKDAGEIGAGHAVTVLYEIAPVGTEVPGALGPLKYQRSAEPPPTPRSVVASPELLTIKLRFQRPEGSKSDLMEIPVADNDRPFTQVNEDFRFAAAVAAMGMSLRESPQGSGTGLDLALDLARSSLGDDPGGWRAEFITVLNRARDLTQPARPPVTPVSKTFE